MARNRQNRDTRMRELLAQECARIMSAEGVRDFSLAKRKAALRLGAPDTRNLPQNREIQDALLDYQRLFGGVAQQNTLRALREAALEAMTFFERFRPRLVGPVLDGTADDYSEVNLHLFADTPEEVVLFLMEHDIPFDTDERRFRYDDDYVFLPVYRFVAGETRMDVCVFTERGLRHPPRSRVDGRPMRRANVSEVRSLLEFD
ncbi:hypothetical protein [Sediminicurvatus halobius]|uniref:Nucleotidyltransferase n=1 Tax=Sediminicurvatus halobius TaxID=2182432 RepID=A0A2U2N6L1_9GAMM|nr:hypothetical protein [Spiribacter halobius]PWG64811.1 hypothetical protein DEM34_03145 [Spiribacter halobius]UEX78335.1 hypothetical protein LMH63_01450 [Spiribacter halobius]